MTNISEHLLILSCSGHSPKVGLQTFGEKNKKERQNIFCIHKYIVFGRRAAAHRTQGAPSWVAAMALNRQAAELERLRLACQVDLVETIPKAQEVMIYISAVESHRNVRCVLNKV